MKKITALLILLSFGNVLAQNPQLFNNTWYLQKVVVASEDYYSSSDAGYPEIFFTQDSEDVLNIYHPECGDLAWYGIEYSGIDSFTSFGIWGGLPGGCMTLPQMEFSAKHYSIYSDTNSVNPISYSLNGAAGQWSLIITNAEGNQAFYRDSELSTNSFQKNIFVLYPNPVHDILTLSELHQQDIIDIRLYDLSGRIIPVNKTINWNNPTLEVSDLSNGLYYINVLFKDGITATQKFIKI